MNLNILSRIEVLRGGGGKGTNNMSGPTDILSHIKLQLQNKNLIIINTDLNNNTDILSHIQFLQNSNFVCDVRMMHTDRNEGEKKPLISGKRSAGALWGGVT